MSYRVDMLEEIESSFKCSINTIHNMRGIGDIKAIIIDVSSLLSRKQIDFIYKEFSPHLEFCNPFYFIFME